VKLWELSLNELFDFYSLTQLQVTYKPHPLAVPHVCTGMTGALHGLKRRGEAPSYVFLLPSENEYARISQYPTEFSTCGMWW
jgi:hypothetical protein